MHQKRVFLLEKRTYVIAVAAWNASEDIEFY